MGINAELPPTWWNRYKLGTHDQNLEALYSLQLLNVTYLVGLFDYNLSSGKLLH